MSDDAGTGDVGSVAEAAKLFGALVGVGARPRLDLGALAGLAGRRPPHARSTSTSRPAPPSAPTARSAGPCTSSARPAPRCATTSPSAAASLMQAAAGVLATAVPRPARDRAGGVEHIDLDDGDDGRRGRRT